MYRKATLGADLFSLEELKPVHWTRYSDRIDTAEYINSGQNVALSDTGCIFHDAVYLPTVHSGHSGHSGQRIDQYTTEISYSDCVDGVSVYSQHHIKPNKKKKSILIDHTVYQF